MMAKKIMRDERRDDLMMGIDTGLLTGEHYRRMGNALWLLLGLLTLSRRDGHIPYSLEEVMTIATNEWGFAKSTLYRQFERLLEHGYLEEDHGRGGFNILALVLGGVDNGQGEGGE